MGRLNLLSAKKPIPPAANPAADALRIPESIGAGPSLPLPAGGFSAPLAARKAAEERRVKGAARIEAA